MIDTLRLSFTDFEINMNKMNQKTTENTESKFGVNLKQSSAKDVITGNTEQELLFIDTDHVPCYGKKAWINTKDFNVDLYNGLCVVQFSAPKVLTGSNYYTSSREETRQSIQKVERDLHDMGVHTSLESANVIRTDLTNTIQTDYPISTYMPVLSMLNGKRARDKRQYAAQTMLWGNTQIQVCCYDKIAEILSYNPRANIKQYPQNSFRTELRLLSKKKVQSSLEIKTGAEIYKHWDNIKEAKVKILKDFLFKSEPDEYRDSLLRDIGTKFNHFAETGERNWLNKFLYSFAIAGLMNQVTTQELAEMYRNILITKDRKDTTIYASVSRFKVKFEADLFANLALFSEEDETYTYADLYQEIYTKVLSA